VGVAVVATLAVGAGPLDAASRDFSAAGAAENTSSCASSAAPMGAGKFTGRVQTPPAGFTFEVNSGKESAAITYSNSTTICQGGQPVSAAALTPGRSVTVYGNVNHTGNTYRVAATLILVAGGAASPPEKASEPPKTGQSQPPGTKEKLLPIQMPPMDRLDKDEFEIWGLQNEVKTLKNQVTTLQSQVTTLQAQVTTDQATLHTLQASLQSLQTQFTHHYHTVSINQPGHLCMAITEYRLTNMAGGTDGVPVIYNVNCQGPNADPMNPGYSKPSTEVLQTTPPSQGH
jgi:hypothetical protein